MTTLKKHPLKYILSTKHSMQVVNVPQGTENLEKDVFRLVFLGPASIFFISTLNKKASHM